jgi:hypothetical protein
MLQVGATGIEEEGGGGGSRRSEWTCTAYDTSFRKHVCLSIIWKCQEETCKSTRRWRRELHPSCSFPRTSGYAELDDKETFTSQLRSTILQNKTINCKKKKYSNIYHCTNISNFSLFPYFEKLKEAYEIILLSLSVSVLFCLCLSLYPPVSVHLSVYPLLILEAYEITLLCVCLP